MTTSGHHCLPTSDNLGARNTDKYAPTLYLNDRLNESAGGVLCRAGVVGLVLLAPVDRCDSLGRCALRIDSELSDVDDDCSGNMGNNLIILPGFNKQHLE